LGLTEEEIDMAIDDAGSFNIKPYVGAIPIKFGMCIRDVENICGKPSREEKDSYGYIAYYDAFNVMYSNDGKVEEIGFFPSTTKLQIESQLLYGHEHLKSPYDVLIELDCSPIKTKGGALIFTKLGISMTGYPDGPDGEKAITCFKKGLWDDLI
jgi:hypothetical protein